MDTAAPRAPFGSVREHLLAMLELARLLLGRALLAQASRTVTGADGVARRPPLAVEIAQLLAGARDARDAELRAEGLDRAVDGGFDALEARLAASAAAGAPMPLGTLAATLGLGRVDVRVVVALAACELDADLERAFTAASEDGGRRRLDVAWLVGLVGGPSFAAREEVARALGPDAPLRRHRVVALTAGDLPLSGRGARLADRVIALLRGDDVIDESLAAICRVTAGPAAPAAAPLVIDDDARARLERALALGDPGARARVVVWGPDGVGKASLVEAIAAAHGRAALRADLIALLAEPAALAERLAACAREAALRRAVLVLDGGADLPRAELGHEVAARVGAAIAALPAAVAVVTTEPPMWLPPLVPDLIELAVPAPSYKERIALWQRALPADVALAQADDLERVAGRYSFGGAAIARAAHRAAATARIREPAAPRVTLDDLADAARLMFSHRLGAVAQRIPAGFTWDDLVLPDETVDQIREVVRFARRRPFLLEEWGFARKLPYGRGVSAILAGPPGTGKTMVAQLLAKELGYDLYRIDLSQVVNKYVGETEKNLARIFAEAEHSHAVLFFDEADAMFARRTDVKSSNDRYANLEVNYLLQRMETFDGVTLLATNLEQGIDEAFKRRVRFTVQFELPDADERERLWRSMFPAAVPLAGDIDWTALADKYAMAGGYIKKAALRAALAAADAEPPRPIAHADLARAAAQEYREMGRVTAT